MVKRQRRAATPTINPFLATVRMPTVAATPTVIICPGNGCSDIRDSNWYGYLYEQLKQREIPCICDDFPDPLHARRDRWIPFIRSMAEKHASSEDNVILVGHSSGAQAALRYAELYPVQACVLVSATYSDLGDAHERASRYYPQPGAGGKENNPYQFDLMKENCPIWHQFHSNDDPFIPLHEAEKIRDGLQLTADSGYHMLPGRSHFFKFDPKLLEVILELC
jgi:predicted alpha/beta hydrolase family esterase